MYIESCDVLTVHCVCVCVCVCVVCVVCVCVQVYALEIQMYTEQKNNKKLKALYEQSLHIKSAIPHPLIMGVIRGTRDRCTSMYICIHV